MLDLLPQGLAAGQQPHLELHEAAKAQAARILPDAPPDIIVGSYKDRSGVPYLEIGPNFYHLSGLDKRKVTETLDAIYQVTAHTPGMYFIKDAATQKVIGTCSKEGLNLE